jgi:hypothetical protein
MSGYGEQRRQFGRICAAGLGPEEAKALMPRCQRCTTTALWHGLKSPKPAHRLR